MVQLNELATCFSAWKAGIGGLTQVGRCLAVGVPGRRIRPKGQIPAGETGNVGREDRQEAIVGYAGSVTDEGE